MDEPLWELFWTTGLPEAYALAKEAGVEETGAPDPAERIPLPTL